MRMSAAPLPVADSFRLEHCPQCAYDLTGLAPAGVCPECGGSYDTQTVELTGTPHGSHVTLSNAPPRQFRRQLLPWYVIGVGGILACFTWMAPPPFRGRALLSFAVIFALVCAESLIGIGRRCAAGRPATVRVRMNCAGVVQDDDADEPPAAATLRATAPIVVALGYVALLYWLFDRRLWAPAIITSILVVPTLAKWRRDWLARRAVLRAPDGERLTSSRKRRVLVPSPWSHVRTVAIGMAPDDQTCRIIITSQAGVKAGTTGDVADIEVPCTPTRADELRTRVAAWREYWRDKPKG